MIVSYCAFVLLYCLLDGYFLLYSGYAVTKVGLLSSWSYVSIAVRGYDNFDFAIFQPRDEEWPNRPGHRWDHRANM